MRKAFNDYGLLIEDDIFVGISLGYDHCSEHEWGIRGIREKFKISDTKTEKNLGLPSRSITTCADNLFFKKDKKNGAALWMGRINWNDGSEYVEELPHELKNYQKTIESDKKYNEDWLKRYPEDKGRRSVDPMISAWDENTFGVAVVGEKEVKYLEELYEAFKNNNVAITRLNISGNNPFANASLSLIIKDRLPQYAVEELYNADKKAFNLIVYEKKIGMTRIKEKNKGNYGKHKYYMACSPSWIDYEDKEHREKRKEEMKTKFDIMYWINYSDDDDNFGWYSVEEIKKWLTSKNLKLTQIRKGR